MFYFNGLVKQIALTLHKSSLWRADFVLLPPRANLLKQSLNIHSNSYSVSSLDCFAFLGVRISSARSKLFVVFVYGTSTE